MDDHAFVFLDANILLHFKPPNQIDWPALCGARRVDLVMYPLLLTGVSNQKDMHREKHIRKRAGKRTSEIREWLSKRDVPIRTNVFVHPEGREPRDLISELGLDRRIRDDMIIAHAVSYLREGSRVLVAALREGGYWKADKGIIRPSQSGY